MLEVQVFAFKVWRVNERKKVDLLELAEELGEIVPERTSIFDLKSIIIRSKGYDESYVKEVLSRIIDDRISREEREHELEK